MKKLTSNELRKLYLDFFAERGHTIISSASLIPQNDPTVLFTTAGMHPLVPYLMGEKHPGGKRLTNVQKCVRTDDIDEVGDYSHCTFFEMLGNWSLGDYFKTESINWSFEFLTGEKYLGIDKNRLAVSVFAGDADAPKDAESAEIWQKCGIPSDKIFFLPKKNNWWGPAGQTGPCGPDTEIFYDTGRPSCGEGCGPACDCGKYLEIWNNVFMQYHKTAEGKFLPLEQKNVDTGMGLERTISVLGGFGSNYETDLFAPAIEKIEALSGKKHIEGGETAKAMRIVADHIRTAVFLLGDEVGIVPGNIGQGYILRRLIRRAVRFAMRLGMQKGDIVKVAEIYISVYREAYPELTANTEKITGGLLREEEKFSAALVSGEREFNKVIKFMTGGIITGGTAFKLYDTFGFPIEMTVELAAEQGMKVDVEGFNEKFVEHQEKSQAAGAQQFKGGLADAGEMTTKLHTATHLLQAALRRVLGGEVAQKGSNITAERLRFDFSFERPMADAEIKATEKLVNEAITAALPVVCEEMPVKAAMAKNAIGLFGDKYGETVKVYTIGGVSCEICGGPHVENTKDLGRFEIVKEQSSSAGVRRIKAILTDK